MHEEIEKLIGRIKNEIRVRKRRKRKERKREW